MKVFCRAVTVGMLFCRVLVLGRNVYIWLVLYGIGVKRSVTQGSVTLEMWPFLLGIILKITCRMCVTYGHPSKT